ncbi:MAG: glycosyltransferase [Candidatus Nitronauta litoralis]|uniref:Glycosyltransferase n=1 Tax=Candidatus Nitronauta litoralis TaxID=2705533 RepID=A0A7T0BYT4_9BACT|nr:MAG: glycosyltransferase [Candidatus Nitronauta litoralis]
MNLNILTFNWHEPYICNLSRLNHTFFVVAPEVAPGKLREWDKRMRSLPGNCHLISPEQAREKLQEGDFDLVLAHNVKDLLWLKNFDLPKICVFHCRLSTEIALSETPIDKTEYLKKVKSLLQDVHPVFISQNKKNDWNLPGAVIPHGIDINDFPQYSGNESCILRVGNLLKEMDIARGYTRGEAIISGYPHATLGLNPGLPGSRLSESFKDLQEHYRQCRVYLNTLPPEYEDGYNLSLLEAMATGMPVISTVHPESPVIDGKNGYISDDTQYLRKKCGELLEDKEKAKELGLNSRSIVQEQFPMDRFLSSWTGEIELCIKNYLKTRGYDNERQKVPFSERKRKNILMDFVSHPATTAYYLERAFRQSHNVITCGAMINLDVIHQWDLGNLKWPIEPQDIFRGAGEKVDGVLKELPADWNPDFYFYVETGLSDVPVDLEKLSIPKVCYLIDTHIHLEKHFEIAKRFDVIFLAQKKYVDILRAQGNDQVFWLPLACDPDIHGKVETEKLWDVGFVGSVTPANPRRKKLLDFIGSRFDLKVDRKFMDEMARHFCESRIVFNNAIKNDLNMRVFEAMCTGSMLITDEAVGLEDLFEDQQHFVMYRDDSLLETIQYYLENPEQRETIAEEGRREVLAHHTYSHRANQMIDILDEIYRASEEDVEGSEPVSNVSNYYEHVRHDMLPLIPEEARSILEIGCGAGKTGQFLKESRGAFVAGVELNPDVAEEAKSVLDDVISGNIEEMDLPYEPGSFDCILCGDVLEHLVDPLKVLEKLKGLLVPGGKIVASIPNVQFFGVIHHLSEGNWTYQDEGILDRTHLRFFTLKEIKTLFENAGFEINEIQETLDPQYEEYKKSGQNCLKVGRVTINDLSEEELRRFFVFQYRFSAGLSETKPENEKKNISRDSVMKERQLNEAKTLEANGNWKEAIKVYGFILVEHPENLVSWKSKGNCHLQMQEFKESREAFKKAFELDPESPEIMMNLAVVSFQVRDYKEAEKWFERLLEFDSYKDKGLCGIGMLKQQVEANNEAIELFYKALQVNPENGIALSSLLKLAYLSGEFRLAESALENYLEIHPANLNMLFGLAGLYFEQDRLTEAREVLDQILIFDSSNNDALELLKKVEERLVFSKG